MLYQPEVQLDRINFSWSDLTSFPKPSVHLCFELPYHFEPSLVWFVLTVSVIKPWKKLKNSNKFKRQSNNKKRPRSKTLTRWPLAPKINFRSCFHNKRQTIEIDGLGKDKRNQSRYWKWIGSNSTIIMIWRFFSPIHTMGSKPTWRSIQNLSFNDRLDSMQIKWIICENSGE